MAIGWNDAALAAAGLIGSGVAVMHGVLVQRLMVRPFEALSTGENRLSGTVLRLVPLLLHFSTLCWFLGGLALIAASCCLDGEARLATGTFVGAFYLYGALGNLWATRGRHPGWMLMAAALVLIAFGLGGG
jgi:hypothetical protein